MTLTAGENRMDRVSETSPSIRVEIKGLILDPTSKTPIVLLHDTKDNRFLPIWIGVFEANAIALRIEGIEPPRPLTHDLFHTSLEILAARIERVTISDLKDNTFYAVVSLRSPNGEFLIDSRPSDAIALALRADAPIFVREAVLDSAQAAELTRSLTDEDKLKKWLEEAEEDDFGEYKM